MIKRLLRLVGRWARKPVNHTSWVAVVTPTDRPKSVRNRCLIELFCGVVCVVTLPFLHFCWCRGFCHRTESDLFLFLFILNFSFVFLPYSSAEPLVLCERKTKRSDCVLWQKPMQPQKKKATWQSKTPPKTFITQRFRIDLGRSE